MNFFLSFLLSNLPLSLSLSDINNKIPKGTHKYFLMIFIRTAWIQMTHISPKIVLVDPNIKTHEEKKKPSELHLYQFDRWPRFQIDYVPLHWIFGGKNLFFDFRWAKMVCVLVNWNSAVMLSFLHTNKFILINDNWFMHIKLCKMLNFNSLTKILRTL